MSDWLEELTPEERRSWDDFVSHVRRETVHKMAESAFVMSLVPGGEPDLKFAVELGLAIMLDKPVIAVAFAGLDVPPGLRRVAHAVIELEHDLDTEAGQQELHRKLGQAMDPPQGGP